MTGLEAALASALLKLADNKLVPLITSEFASIAGVTKDLSELQDILVERLQGVFQQFVIQTLIVARHFSG